MAELTCTRYAMSGGKSDDSRSEGKILTFRWNRDNMIVEKECYR